MSMLFEESGLSGGVAPPLCAAIRGMPRDRRNLAFDVCVRVARARNREARERGVGIEAVRERGMARNEASLGAFHWNNRARFAAVIFVSGGMSNSCVVKRASSDDTLGGARSRSGSGSMAVDVAADAFTSASNVFFSIGADDVTTGALVVKRALVVAKCLDFIDSSHSMSRCFLTRLVGVGGGGFGVERGRETAGGGASIASSPGRAEHAEYATYISRSVALDNPVCVSNVGGARNVSRNRSRLSIARSRLTSVSQ